MSTIVASHGSVFSRKSSRQSRNDRSSNAAKFLAAQAVRNKREQLLQEIEAKLDDDAKVARSRMSSMAMVLGRHIKRDASSINTINEDIYIVEPWIYYSRLQPPLAIDVGHIIAKKFRDCIDDFNTAKPGREFKTTPQQKKMHVMMFAGMLRLIYGSACYEANESIIMNMWRYKPTDMKQWFKFITSRRFGKTWCLSFFALDSMINIPNAHIAIFSPSQGQSNNVIAIIKKLWSVFFPNIKAKFFTNKIYYEISPTDIRRTTAYSNSVNISFRFSRSRRRLKK